MNSNGKTQTKIKVSTFNKDAFVVYVLLALTLVLGGLYMYFVSMSVVHVVMRTEAEHAIAAAYSALGELETELMLAQHKVSAEIATLSGYTEPKSRIFIDRSANTFVFRE